MIRTVVIGVALVCALAGGAAAQFDSCNVSLHQNLDLTVLNAESGNDCWGYVSPSGREYALMGLADKMTVVEITDPDNPVIVGSISHSSSLWGDIKVYQGYAYVSNESGGGIDVINLTNVDNGVVTLVQRMPTGGSFGTSHNLALNTASGHLYLCGSDVNGGAPVVFSLANPAAPVEVGRWTQATRAYHHDAQIVSYTSGPYAGKEILFGASESRGVDILDVTNKANITLMSRTPYPGVSYCHQVWTEDLQYLFIDDELDESSGATPTTRTIVFDISNLSAPTLVTTFTSGLPSIDHNLYVRDNFVYEANYKTGLRIFDVSNPLAAFEVGYFDTYPGDNGLGFEGAWSNFPFFPSGTVIVSDINRGLFILDASGVQDGRLAFSFPNGLPEMVDPSGGTTLRVNVAGVGGTSPAEDTGVLYVNRGSGFEPFPMSQVSPHVYDAIFPTSTCGETIEYYVSVETTAAAAKTDPCSAPDIVYSALSGSGFGPAVFQDNAETAQAWTAGPNTATTGAWIRGNPNGTGAQPEDDHTPGAGVNCWYTQSNPPGDIGNGDVDGGTVRPNSPTFDLSGGDAVITYWRWYFERDNGGDDGWLAEISNDNGASWVTIEALSPYGGQWEQVQFLVSDLLAPTAQMKLRFSASDGPVSGDIVEAAIDDITVAPLECPQLPAAVVTGAVSRKANPSGPGGACDVPLIPARASDPRSSGISEVRIAFNIAPAVPEGSGVTLEQATCAAPAFAHYSGGSTVSGTVDGTELVLTFSPALENGRSYRISIGPSVTAVAGQSVEIRGLTGDANGDGSVNATDRSVVVGAWTGSGFSCATDIDSSGQTNATDRSIVVGAWTGSANCAP